MLTYLCLLSLNIDKGFPVTILIHHSNHNIEITRKHSKFHLTRMRRIALRGRPSWALSSIQISWSHLGLLASLKSACDTTRRCDHTDDATSVINTFRSVIYYYSFVDAMLIISYFRVDLQKTVINLKQTAVLLISN